MTPLMRELVVRYICHNKSCEWHKKSTGAYEAALRNNLIEKATRHMANKKVQDWTKLLEKQKKNIVLKQWIGKTNSFLAAENICLA